MSAAAGNPLAIGDKVRRAHLDYGWSRPLTVTGINHDRGIRYLRAQSINCDWEDAEDKYERLEDRASERAK